MSFRFRDLEGGFQNFHLGIMNIHCFFLVYVCISLIKYKKIILNTCLQSSPSVIVARRKYQQMLQHPVLGAQKHGTPWKFEIDPDL